MTTYHPTFDVDKEGLAKLMSRRGPSFAILELLQNAWDEATTRVDVTLDYLGRGKARLVVTDDNPTGFANIAHAYTLFADSAKKTDPTKRGRFNLGEKLVIAICDDAEVSTTTGCVRFSAKGRTMHPRERTMTGSVFSGTIRMTRPEFDAACIEVATVLVPHDVQTFFNGKRIESREPLHSFNVTLPTELADSEGNLRRSTRIGLVSIHDVREGEEATIYEMGIPVVATGDRWHVNVMQKVPLNVDRDNVTPSYLRDLRRAVLNECHGLLDETASGETWINDAIEDPDVTAEALNAALDLRFGERRVTYDPSDPEANKLAVVEGYTVVGARSLPKAAWGNVREHGAMLRAGAVTPSPKPYGDGHTRHEIAESDWSDGMRRFATFSRRIARELLDIDHLGVHFVNDPQAMSFAATWCRLGPGSAQLEWNVRTLGRAYFDLSPANERALALLIHEMGHHHGGGDHLDRRYLNELCALGAACTHLAVSQPALFALDLRESGVPVG